MQQNNYMINISAPAACSEQQFSCNKTHKCIPKGWMCDGHADCATSDDSDETHPSCK